MSGGQFGRGGRLRTARRAALRVGLISLLGPLMACGFPVLVETTTGAEAPPAEEEAQPATATPEPPVVLLLDSPTPTPTATATFTATYFPPQFTSTVNANCRSGPGTMYDIVGNLPSGTTVPIAGKDVTETWWFADYAPDCWVSSTTGTADGDLASVPVLPSPPTPTPTRTPTPTYTPMLGITIRPPVTARIPFFPITASATIDRTSYSGPCPYRANWSGTISVSGAMTVSYLWQMAYGSGAFSDTMQGGVLTFGAAGTQAAVPYWLQTSTDGVLRARLHISSPSTVYSNEASVTIDCTP